VLILKRIIILLSLILITSCQGSINRIGKPLLGTVVNITFIGDTEKAPKTAQEVFAEIERIESLMSPYRPGSDVYRLNRDGGAGPVTVSAETYDLIRKSADLSAETGGCFDITFASMANLWDYKNKNFVLPSRPAVAALLPLIGSRNIIFNPDKMSISFARPGMKIGLGAIAKGYAVSRGIDVLRKRGVSDAIVEAGGDLQVIGTKHGKPWITGLRHPRRSVILLTVDLADMDAVATSGDYERFVMRSGVRYHHIIDPRTGYPANTFSSVSVFSKSAVLSDAYATAIFVMGIDGAREFLKRHGEIDVILADQEVNLYISSRLKDRVTLLEEARVEWL
jgi:thiamine biosynthesis lipoprotein